MIRELIFVSSVQKELAEERKAVRDFIMGNRLFSRYFDLFLFEDLPARDRRPDDLYLDRVDACSVFIALFGSEYGRENGEVGISAVEREFDRATETGKHRLLFIKTPDDQRPHPKMEALTGRAQDQLVYRRFTGISELTGQVYDSLIEYLEERGMIQCKPFDAASSPTARLSDLSPERIRWFLAESRRERGLPLSLSASLEEVLTHLRLMGEGELTNAAVLLFGRDPQRSFDSAVIKCAHFHGVEVAKPIPSLQVFGGTLFDQVDRAVDFVLSKLDRAVSSRETGPRAIVRYEIPEAAITEIIVNAVAHRDYASHAAVQVSIFADRVEVWNPGRLPSGLTPDQLAKPHSSEPGNPLLATPLYLAHFIESLGTGTLDVIRLCREAGLPAPVFEQRGGQFTVTLWRDWLTPGVLAGLALNDRQRQAVTHLKTAGRIGNTDYQRITGSTKKTASRDLEDLVEKGLIQKVGTTGRGVHYVLNRKVDKKGTNETSVDPSGNGDIKGTNETPERGSDAGERSGSRSAHE